MIRLINENSIQPNSIRRLLNFITDNEFTEYDIEAALNKFKSLKQVYSSLNQTSFYDLDTSKPPYIAKLPGGESPKQYYIDCENTDLSNISVIISGDYDYSDRVLVSVTAMADDDNLEFDKLYDYFEDLDLACQTANRLAYLLTEESTKKRVIDVCRKLGLDRS